MVDFGELKGKADELLSQHADQAKTGLGKAGNFAGDRLGHDKVDPLEEKATRRACCAVVGRSRRRY